MMAGRDYGGNADFEDADVLAILNAFTVKADHVRKGHIDTLVRGIKAAGVWAKLDALWVLAAHDAQAARVNWMLPGTFNLTVEGTPTFTADQGYTGNGTDGRLNTGWNPSTNGVNFQLNSAHMGLWVRTTSAAGEDRCDMGVSNFRMDTWRAANTLLTRANHATSIQVSNNTAGYFCTNRSASDAIQIRKNNTSLATNTGASTAISSETMRLLALVTSVHSTKQLSAAHVGGSLTTGEIDSLYGHLNTYISGL